MILRAKIRISERKCKYICNFPSVSIFGEAKVTKKRANRLAVRPLFVSRAHNRAY